MKTKHIIIATILLLSCTELLKAQTWEYVNTLQNEWLQKICTQGLDTVYIVGQNGLIAKSTDRALTWNKQYNPSKVTLNDVIFVNHTTGFAVGSTGTILKTIDAGASWTNQTSGTTYNLNAIAATGLDNIWTVGDNGTILFSKDGGNVWQFKGLSITSNLNDISFKNGQGHIVGNGNIWYKTIDAGNNWTKENFNAWNENNISLESFNLFSICQTSNDTYILYGIENRRLFLNKNNNLLLSTPDIACFLMGNDSIGYNVWSSKITGSNSMIKIQKTKFGYYLDEVRLYPQSDNQSIANDYSNIAVVNDKIGYIVSGNFLYKISTIIDDLKDIQIHPSIKIHQDSKNELILNSELVNISSIELFDIQGNSILKNSYNSSQQNIKLNISNLINNIYIINTTFIDGENFCTKWLKQ